MPDQTPAEQLHAAAEILRHAAQQATHEQGPRWMLGTTVADKAAVVLDHPDEPTVLIQTYAERLEAVNAYLVRVHPGVGAALADWLDATASEMEAVAGTEYEYGEFASWDAALAVARELAGSPS